MSPLEIASSFSDSSLITATSSCSPPKSKATRIRREIVAGIVIDPSEAIKWASKLVDIPLEDNGKDDMTALYNIQCLVRRNNADAVFIYQGAGRRLPVMIVTRRKYGRFTNDSEGDSEEVMDEKLKLKKDKRATMAEKLLIAQKVDVVGFGCYFY